MDLADLDQLLDRAAPTVAPRTPELGHELVALVAESEQGSLRRRRRLQAAVVSAVAVGVVGLVPAAGASGLLPFADWFPWTASSGTTCRIGFEVRMADDGSGQPMTPAVAAMTTPQKQEVVVVAREFLAEFDYSSVDTDAAIKKWQAAEARVRGDQLPEERQPKLSGNDLELTAVGQEVAHRVVAFLKQRGLNPDAVLISEGSRCEK
jgi:hypothetical protein